MSEQTDDKMTVRVTRKLDELVLWRNRLAKEAEKNGARMFLGKPDMWYEKPHWGCVNGHVSHRFLKSETKGDLCLACGKNVIPIPPMTEPDLKKVVEGGFTENANIQGERSDTLE